MQGGAEMAYSDLDYTIPPINNGLWLNEYIPGALLSVQGEEPFQIYEANDYYFDLIGYTRKEVQELFQNKGFATLHPADRDLAVQNFVYQTQHSSNAEFSLSCRLVNKTHGYKYVRFQGRLAHTAEGNPIMYLLVTDVTDLTQTLQALELAQEFNTIISTFTENSYFDYNILTDTMYYSKHFAAKLGLPMIIPHYSNSLSSLKVNPPESLESLRSHFSNPTEEEQKSQLHIISISGEDIWYHFKYKFLFENGEAIRVVGEISDITKQYQQMAQLTYQASHDTMTGFYLKNVTKCMIDEFIKLNSNLQEYHAFFMIDLDNFKKINDTFGHDYGDQVIIEVSQKISKIFRSHDIIGRFGGDEFIVFMKDCKSMDVVYNKALTICNSLRKCYSNGVAEVMISASIGLSTFPLHGKDYDGLSRVADEALYIAKSKGRDQFFHHCQLS